MSKYVEESGRLKGGVLTPEMLEEAAKKVIERSGHHSCENGHLVRPDFYTKNEGQFCLQCCRWLEPRSG